MAREFFDRFDLARCVVAFLDKNDSLQYARAFCDVDTPVAARITPNDEIYDLARFHLTDVRIYGHDWRSGTSFRSSILDPFVHLRTLTLICFELHHDVRLPELRCLTVSFSEAFEGEIVCPILEELSVSYHPLLNRPAHHPVFNRPIDSFPLLRKLHLSNLHAFNHVIRINSLQSLSLFAVRSFNSKIECPLLEDLKIVWCEAFNHSLHYLKNLYSLTLVHLASFDQKLVCPTLVALVLAYAPRFQSLIDCPTMKNLTLSGSISLTNTVYAPLCTHIVFGDPSLEIRASETLLSVERGTIHAPLAESVYFCRAYGQSGVLIIPQTAVVKMNYTYEDDDGVPHTSKRFATGDEGYDDPKNESYRVPQIKRIGTL